MSIKTPEYWGLRFFWAPQGWKLSLLLQLIRNGPWHLLAQTSTFYGWKTLNSWLPQQHILFSMGSMGTNTTIKWICVWSRTRKQITSWMAGPLWAVLHTTRVLFYMELLTSWNTETGCKSMMDSPKSRSLVVTDKRRSVGGSEGLLVLG